MHKQPENGKGSGERSGRIYVTAKVLNVQLVLDYCAPEMPKRIQLACAPKQAKHIVFQSV